MYLNCHSYYSLRYGTMPVEKLVAQAKKNDVSAMAMTDINNSMGMMDFISECRLAHIKPVAGIEFRDEKSQLLFIAIARNNTGFREINEFLTRHNIEKTPLPVRAPSFDNAYVIYPFKNRVPIKPSENEFIGIRPDEINKLVTSRYRYYEQQLIALLPVTLAGAEEHELHRHLRAIGNNTLLSKVSDGDVASQKEVFMPPDYIPILYSDYPQIIKNTERLTDECFIQIDFDTVKNKRIFTSSRYDDRLLLEKLALDGMAYRYGKSNAEAKKRIKNELEVIDKLGFSAYFLITWDIIRYSMSRGFYHVGRGSGANSIVAYCLKITDVDPIELDLYFERFINPKRSSPPDFDIDFSWKERDEVLDYIFKRYGKGRTALIGTVSTFHGRSILRELGKVYGLPKEEIDSLVDHPGELTSRDSITDQIFEVGNLIQDFPNLRSIHAGGVLISEEPLTCYTALDMPPKGLPTTQWDMYVAEELRFEKLDILSQRGIGHIRECADIVKTNRGISVDVHDVKRFKKDTTVLKQLRSAEAIGCFYVESPAMRGLLKKLRCDSYISLVAASSIIRPGVARSGMMREYIRRFHHPDDFDYLHPVMK